MQLRRGSELLRDLLLSRHAGHRRGIRVPRRNVGHATKVLDQRHLQRHHLAEGEHVGGDPVHEHAGGEGIRHGHHGYAEM
jgi:hypothetical protein